LKREQIISPAIPLILLACIGICSVVLERAVPEKGIQVAGFTLKFKSPVDTASRTIEDVGAYLAQLDSVAEDTIATKVDTLKVKRVVSKTSLQFRDDDASSLYPFFTMLDEVKASGTNVHVLHYGDSQIESDRISGYLRQKWQEEFGGRGPGLVAPLPITASANITQSQSGNWKRYTAYGFDNGKAGHSRYGVMAAIGRFTQSRKKEEIDSTEIQESWIELRPSSMAHSYSKTYSQAGIYFGYHQFPLVLSVAVGDSVIANDTIPPTSYVLEKTYRFPPTPSKLKFKFSGADSPDVHGICLQNEGGVNVDNLALRGSNGNIFKRIATSDLKTELNDLNAQLIMLQFGGNSLPYVESNKSAKEYGNFFQAQIQYLKTLAPQAAFIIIGPADMSKMVDGTWQTYPYLEAVRDAMKEAAFNEGCAFWDMYEVMGGKNSMVSWVTNSPPYAGTDYVHFTPLGARKVAELLYKAIDHEYDAWKNASLK